MRWSPYELPPPRYAPGQEVWVVLSDLRLLCGRVVAAQWQTECRVPWIRYMVEVGDWEWHHLPEAALDLGKKLHEEYSG